MKKAIAIFTIAALTACGGNDTSSFAQRPEDIKLSNLKTACDYTSAIEKLADAALKIKTEQNYEFENSQEHLDLLENKLKDILEAGRKKFTEAEFRECPNWKNQTKKMNRAFYNNSGSFVDDEEEEYDQSKPDSTPVDRY
jgi:hypothetical protein